ncbi:MAG: ABC transporter ATP-binding protein, partial [Candidatus Methylomirabilales bacterium]
VFFDGTDTTHLPTHEIIRLGIARTFQSVRVFKRMTVYENVWAGQHRLTRSGLTSLLPGGKHDEKRLYGKVDEILELMGLRDHREMIAGNLPFGLQRRLEVARALATEPRLLLLDEPAGGLSRQEVESLMASIKKINATGKTILIIEHDMKVIMNLSKRIAVLNFGRKIAEGPPETVRSSPAVVEAYLGTKGGSGA